MGVFLALASALGFGVSDVAGAVATRRASVLSVTLGIQVTGFIVLVPALLLLPGIPSSRALWLGALAGFLGNGGLVLYLRSMAVGPIGVISPTAALVGAAVPVAWGVVLSGDQLSSLQVGGVVAGLVAVLAVAYVPGTPLKRAASGGTVAALVAGAGFGLFFVVLDATPADSGLWPLLGARIAGSTTMALLLVVARRPPLPRGTHRLVLLSGTTDVAANLLFLLATRSGLLSLVSLLTSLYPVVALLVARLLLAERLSRLQGGGVLLALTATGLLVVG